MREPLSAESEDRIMSAVDVMAGHVADGASPTDALVKAAREVDLPGGHLPLVAQAYNIGRTIRQRRDHADVSDKAASFDLADVDEARRVLYPDAPAKAAEAAAPEYERPPTWYATAKAAAASASMLKAAEAASPPRPATPPPLDAEREIIKAAGAASLRARRVSRFKQAALAARRRLDDALDKLAAYFESPLSLAPSDVRGNVEILHGRPGVALLDAVAASRPGLDKRASRDPYHPAVGGPYPLIEAALGRASDLVAVEDLIEALAKEAAVMDAAAMAPFSPSPPRSPLLAAVEAKEAALGGVVDKAMNAGIFSGVNAMLTSPPGEAEERRSRAVDSAMRRIATPEHEQALREIEAKAMLHEMLNSDDMLSAHDPYEVAHHYNQLARFAPRLAGQPLAAMPAVRKAVGQGSLDTFDAAELAGVEHKLRGGAEHAAR